MPLSDLTLSVLIFLIFFVLAAFHFLLIREYAKQKRIQKKRLEDLELIVQQEIQRSRNLDQSSTTLKKIKKKTDRQLELIRLQIKSLDNNSGEAKL